MRQLSSVAASAREPFRRVPPPSHRHATPSGPWPWLDLGSDLAAFKAALSVNEFSNDINDSIRSPASDWDSYPQNLFPNWTPDQLRRCKMKEIPSKSSVCWIYPLDVLHDGHFRDIDPTRVAEDEGQDFWESLQLERHDDVRVRSLFIEDISVPVLQALGTKYIVEPFFFSSSLNWIPSRYQEEDLPGSGDHLTITLPFIRTIQNPLTRPPSPSAGVYALPTANKPTTFLEDEQVIDTQAPLSLSSSGRILLLDLLSIHMVRSSPSSTIISYHPTRDWRTTTARKLWSVVGAVGNSVYWNKIFQKSEDPTFVLLAMLWYPLYAWDEALEVLYDHIGELESRVIKTNEMRLVRELHIIQAHLLHYGSLLEDFRKSVAFILDSPFSTDSYDPKNHTESQETMKKECNHLLSEIHRLEDARVMQTMRLENVMALAFATVNIEDSKHMRRLTSATVRDSAAMKQISYLTMFFLPASFVASIFGMNVKEINGAPEPITHYVATAVAFTIATVWLIMALGSTRYHKVHEHHSGWERFCWPVLYFKRKKLGRTGPK